VGNGVADRLVYKKDPPGACVLSAPDGHSCGRFTPCRSAANRERNVGRDSWTFTGHTNVWAQ